MATRLENFSGARDASVLTKLSDLVLLDTFGSQCDSVVFLTASPDNARRLPNRMSAVAMVVCKQELDKATRFDKILIGTLGFLVRECCGGNKIKNLNARCA